jgi:tRNA (guanine37-N1)-methyltransferase
MLKFDVITLFPNLFSEHISNLPFKRALAKKIIEVNFHNPRDFAIDKRGTVDDKPYGGGVGMILRIEPIYDTLNKIYKGSLEQLESNKDIRSLIPQDSKIILLSPSGRRFSQKDARELSKMSQVTFICGRYEGVDSRVEKHLCTDVISIGDFVVSGGELPALTIMESIVRLLPNVLEKKEASENESFSQDNIEYEQYTRPDVFKGLKVPDILLSGDHKKIEDWKDRSSLDRKRITE